MTTFNDIIAAAMPALLADPDTKRAVLEYIQAQTKASTPAKSERQVWIEYSVTTRLIPNTYIGGTKEAQLVLWATYNDDMHIGVISAMPVWVTQEPGRGYMQERRVDIFTPNPYRKIVDGDYTDVIRAAQVAMPDALAAWDEQLASQEEHA